MSLRALQGPTGGGAPVGGSGTSSPSTIPRWTGASTLGDSIIIQGSTANAIGIGNAPTTDLAGYKALEVGGLGSGFVNADNDLWITANAKHSGGGWKYAVAASTPSNSIRANAGAIIFNRAGNGTAGNALTWLESARIDSSGNVGIGTASPGAQLDVVGTTVVVRARASSTNTTPVLGAEPGMTLRNTNSTVGNYTSITNRDSNDNANTQINFINVNHTGSGAINFVTRDSVGGSGERARIDSSGNLILNTANTGATIQAAGSQQGLKLPNAPNNGDPNTLDSYREGTRALSAGDLSGWTYVTATQYWTLVGRTVTLHTVFTGGTSSATGGATIATPPLLTPLRIAAGAAVNSSGTALGNGVCVVASTSSTTGTVITSNAISSSAVDKVLTVTYETAGL